jgi:hypothetical protein
MPFEPPSADVKALLARGAPLIPSERYRRGDGKFLVFSLSNEAPGDYDEEPPNPILLAALTNQPQIVESLLVLLPNQYSVKGLASSRMFSWSTRAACTIGAVDFFDYWVARFGGILEPEGCLVEAVRNRRWQIRNRAPARGRTLRYSRWPELVVWSVCFCFEGHR